SIIRDYALVDARNEAFANVTLEEVVVMPGDSLWQLAESHPVAGVSTADVVSYISESNDLPSANLQVGQHLLVPAC
ncbi:MAG: LysM peptidoglycan-binding domain-containing protein, partial [Atopobiaceae bacterium]|nr:LysM peptidoglycan-binding domain-containing protein [Atopobiaceae bacterium]